MKKFVSTTAALCFSLMIAGGLHAQQQYAEGEPGCVQAFYDRAYYNWLSYRNTCSEDIYASWVSHSPGLNGAATIPVGGKANTGWSAQEIQAKGGLEVYVCPRNYIPVDANGDPISQPVAQYRCKYNGD